MRKFRVRHIHLRFGEHDRQALLVQRIIDTLDIIAVQQAQTRDRLDLQNMANFPQELLRLHRVGGFLFHINAFDAHEWLSFRDAKAR